MTNYFKYQKKIYCEDTGETCIGYVKYLQSKHWQNLRDRLIGDKKVCAGCGYVVPVVQLHHMTYERLGHELDSDLAVLCPKCHDLVHDAKSQHQTNKPKGKKRKGGKKSKKKFCGNCRSYSEKVNMMNTQNLTFGEFLQRKREEKQITLRKMAEMLHVSAPYLSDIEKGRRNPPEMEKLEQISQILLLTDEEKSAMLDLAGKMRNSVAPDLPEYIIGRDYVSAALRTARDLDAGEAEWMRFVDELKKRKG